MGLVRKQAYSSTINIVIGFIAGAINTIIVLPRAFENNLDDWGLLKLILSFALILSPIFGLGVNNIIIKEYLGEKSQKYKDSILGFTLTVATIGSLLLVLFVYSNGLRIFVNSENATLVEQNILYLVLLSVSLTLGQVFSGFIVAKHKTPFIQLVNDSFLKVSYLIISLYYLFYPFSFELFFLLYVISYVLTLFIYFFYSKSLGFKARYSFNLLSIKELLNYGFYTVLDRGAAIIVANLDLIMIAFLLPLSNVAIYGLAFFMATVILIPQKAIMTPLYPLISLAIKNNQRDELSRLYKQSSINQLIIGGVLFSLIWANINDIFALIPSDFSDGKWVVFYIGLSRLFILITGISNALIIFSPYYRVNLIFNLFLVVLTIITNYYLISRYGITGAAMATSITFLTYNILKTIYIQFRFKIQPFTIETFKSLIVLILVTISASMITISENNAIISILSKSVLISIFMAIGFYGLNVKAEILDVPGRVLKRFFNR